MEIKKFNQEISTQRLEAFSDGVFAIAITLLILEIKIPHHEDIDKFGSLSWYLLNLWPSIFAYVFSFVIIGIYWANHHYLFKLFKKTDHTFNMINVLFLMGISFLPYPTAILGDYITDDLEGASAVTFYAIGITIPSLFWLTMWLYASYKGRLTDQRLKPEFIKKLTAIFVISNVIYISAVVISFFSKNIALISVIIMTLVYLKAPKRPEYITQEDSKNPADEA
jgi:uncharacterized membrane protein